MLSYKRRKNEEYKKSDFKTENVNGSTWFIFRWEVFVIIFATLFIVIINQIPNWIISPMKDGSIDPIFSYPLRDNIIYSSFSIFTTVGIAIFVGIFTEIGRFAGKYGSSIFILVPSFIWLLSDRADNHIVEILQTTMFLGTTIFWSVVGLVGFLGLLMLLKKVLIFNVKLNSTKLKIEMVYNMFVRIIIVLINILIVLLLGIGFINYAIFSLHLADNTPTQIAAASANNLHIGPYNLHSEKFTTFIAIIAVVFAILLISIGLIASFTHSKTEDVNETIDVSDSANSLIIETTQTTEITEITNTEWKEWGQNG